MPDTFIPCRRSGGVPDTFVTRRRSCGVLDTSLVVVLVGCWTLLPLGVGYDCHLSEHTNMSWLFHNPTSD